MTSYPPPGREPAPEGWGFSGGQAPGPQLDPLSQTLLKIVVGLAVLLIVLIGIAIKYDNGGEADLNPIAEAAQRTAAMPGARMAMTVQATRNRAAPSATGWWRIVRSTRPRLLVPPSAGASTKNDASLTR